MHHSLCCTCLLAPPLLACLPSRPYTPVTDDDTLGQVEFVIKVYPNGKMTQIMDQMKVGDTMLMKGPRGRFQYSRNMKRAIGEQQGQHQRGTQSQLQTQQQAQE